MDRFEEQLKQLPLCGPSMDLRRRIFGEYSREKVFVRMFARRIPMGWAASLALAAGLMGVTFSNIVSNIFNPDSIYPCMVWIIGNSCPAGDRVDINKCRQDQCVIRPADIVTECIDDNDGEVGTEVDDIRVELYISLDTGRTAF